MIRCSGCALFEDKCVCSSLIHVESSVSVVLIRHCKEQHRGSNTARILHSSLPQSTMLDYGCTNAHLPDLSHITWETSALVFPMFYNPDPNRPPTPVTDISTIRTLIILDGSWKQTSRMLKRMPELIQLPRLEIEPASPPLPRIRHPYFEGGMCTMEAGIQALKPFMTAEQTEQLTQNYILWLDRVRQMSGLRTPLSPGQSFKDARKVQHESNARSQ